MKNYVKLSFLLVNIFPLKILSYLSFCIITKTKVKRQILYGLITDVIAGVKRVFPCQVFICVCKYCITVSSTVQVDRIYVGHNAPLRVVLDFT